MVGVVAAVVVVTNMIPDAITGIIKLIAVTPDIIKTNMTYTIDYFAPLTFRVSLSKSEGSGPTHVYVMSVGYLAIIPVSVMLFLCL